MAYVDPTGHFSTEAIYDYILNGECGRDSVCADKMYESWQGDEEWWNMLLYAQEGDVLIAAGRVRAAGWTGLFYTFLGEGNDLLTGIMRSDPHGNAYSAPDAVYNTNYFDTARLNHIFAGTIRLSHPHGDHFHTDRISYVWGDVLVWNEASHPMLLLGNGYAGAVTDGQRTLSAVFFNAAGLASYALPTGWAEKVGTKIAFAAYGTVGANLLHSLALNQTGSLPGDVRFEISRNNRHWQLIAHYDPANGWHIRRTKFRPS